MIVRNMERELEEIMEKIKEKYKINGTREPLLSQENVVYMLWRLKGFIWNKVIDERNQKLDCDLGSYIDHLFDEFSSLSDTWLKEIEEFNSKCMEYVDDKKVTEAILDMLILRSIYYQLSKSY